MQFNRAYGGVCFLVSACTLQYQTMKYQETVQRQATYPKDFMNYHFQELHNKEVGDDLAENGWPDDGNGRYTEHFGYGPWYYMNIVKRCHRNDFEHLVTVLPMSLVNGLIYPWTTIGLLSLYFAGRAAYSFGYQEREGAFN